MDAKLAFKDTLTLLDLAKLLGIFTEECPKYNLLGVWLFLLNLWDVILSVYILAAKLLLFLFCHR